jgi:hypothetical protein
MRNLETKIVALKNSSRSLELVNKQLRVALQDVRTENKILCMRASISLPTTSRSVSVSCPLSEEHLVGRLSGSHQNKVLTFDYTKLVTAAVEDLMASCVEPSGKGASTAQIWGLTQSYPLVRHGLVEMTDVFERIIGVRSLLRRKSR